jgi:hypothetical protein
MRRAKMKKLKKNFRFDALTVESMETGCPMAACNCYGFDPTASLALLVYVADQSAANGVAMVCSGGIY